MAAAKPTPASSWSQKPELVTLPSGKRARLREKLNVTAALRAGVITAAMLDDWYAAQRGELEEPARALAFQDACISWLFTEPRCTAGAREDGAIHVSDLDDEDLDFLMERAFGGAPADATFRGDDGGDAPGADGEDVGAEPEPAARSRARDAAGVPDRPPPRRAPGGAGSRKPRAKRARAK